MEKFTATTGKKTRRGRPKKGEEIPGESRELDEDQPSRGEEIRENSRELDEDQPEPGEKTAVFAAKQAGFDSEWTARQAQLVVETGVPELVEALNKGLVAPSKVAKIAEENSEDQIEIALALLAGVYL